VVLTTGGHPNANCKDINVQLDALENAIISADDINNGSSDAEATVSILI
jgi:hypothetical protein